MLYFGFFILLLGIALGFGNISGEFVTFPFLGFIVGSIGGLIFAAGVEGAGAKDPDMTYDEATNYLRRRKSRLAKRMVIYIVVVAVVIGYYAGIYVGLFSLILDPLILTAVIGTLVVCLGLLRLEWRDYRVVTRELARFENDASYHRKTEPPTA